MSMQHKTIFFSEQMETWVNTQVDLDKYGNDSEHFRDLIRRDQERRGVETNLRYLLDEAET